MSLEKAKDMFKEHLRFRMTRARLKNDMKQEYIHTSIKQVVDLNGTKFDPLMARGDAEQLAPEPSITVAACAQYKQSQRFDITALTSKVGDEILVNSARRVINITLIDGTLLESDKLAELKFGFFYDAPPKQEHQEIIQRLKQAEGKTEPYTFFGLLGKKDGGSYKFENPKEFFLNPAATTKKGISLVQKATQLFATPVEERATFQSTGGHKDYSQELGIESVCSLQQDMEKKLTLPRLIQNQRFGK